MDTPILVLNRSSNPGPPIASTQCAPHESQTLSCPRFPPPFLLLIWVLVTLIDPKLGLPRGRADAPIGPTGRVSNTGLPLSAPCVRLFVPRVEVAFWRISRLCWLVVNFLFLPCSDAWSCALVASVLVLSRCTSGNIAGKSILGMYNSGKLVFPTCGPTSWLPSPLCIILWWSGAAELGDSLCSWNTAPHRSRSGSTCSIGLSLNSSVQLNVRMSPSWNSKC